MEGAQAATIPPPATVDAIVRLIRARLSGSGRVHYVPRVPSSAFHEAVARCGTGLDHHGGEVPIALVRDGLDGQATARGCSATYVVTDRRLFGRVETGNVRQTFTDVPYAEVIGVPNTRDGFAPSTVVQLGDGPRRLHLLPKQWHAFFAEMVATIPPAYRTLGPIPALERSTQDPTGAEAASRVVATADIRTWVPLRVVFEAHRRGTIGTEEAARLVPDMMMLARGVVAGRGSVHHGWHSVLPPPALILALSTVLGPAAAVHQLHGGEVFEFAAGSGSGIDGVSPLRSTTGLGWVSSNHRQQLDRVRVHVADDRDAAAFMLFAAGDLRWEPLSVHWWRVVDAIHQALFRVEARYLLGRALFGTELALDELLALPRDVLERSTAGLLGPTDLAMFCPAR